MTNKMLQSRIDYITNVNKFIADYKLSLKEALNTLGWEKNLTNSEECLMVPCPNDVGHRVPKNKFEQHLLKCSLQKSGYTLQDDLFPPASSPGPNCITIDEYQQDRILNTALPAKHLHEQKLTLRPVPQTSDRLISDFTPAERLAMYDYVIKHTSSDNRPVGLDVNLPFSSTQDDSKPKTLEELLAAERDAKRRRMKYKSKNVHTSKKTQTEILREVIQSQMEGFEELLSRQNDEDKKNTKVLKSDLTDHVNTIKSDSSNVKEITRNWDDWLYYKGNPHTRYKKIIQEERDAETKKSKVSSDRCGWNKNRGDRKNRVDDDDYYRMSKMKERDFQDRHRKRTYSNYRNEDYKSERRYAKYHERVRHRDCSSDEKSNVKYERELRYEDKKENQSSKHYSKSSKNEDDYSKSHKKSKKHKHKHHGKKHKSHKRRARRSSEDSNSSLSSD